MTSEKKMNHELLKQNGLEPGRITCEEQEKLYRMIDLEKKRITRMKWATVLSWILLVVLYVLAAVLSIGQTLSSVPSGKVPPTPYLPVIAIVLWWIAILCTASLVVRIFRLRGFRQQQILETLAKVEEHLKHLDEKK